MTGVRKKKKEDKNMVVRCDCATNHKTPCNITDIAETNNCNHMTIGGHRTMVSGDCPEPTAFISAHLPPQKTGNILKAN